ncbi:MAG: hypothetical protein E7Z63_06135 [Thermoplasmata archaeon]|nr:hypothetical protein [Thermoplasmata archaeon]
MTSQAKVLEMVREHPGLTIAELITLAYGKLGYSEYYREKSNIYNALRRLREWGDVVSVGTHFDFRWYSADAREAAR